MRLMKVFGIAMVLALAGLAFTPAGNATATFDHKVMVTFTQPVELPGGRVLDAGKYMMTVVDHNAYRHIVQFYNEDKTQLYATVLAIPNYRLTPSDDVVITFMERPAGSPQAVKAWFYPGEKFGHEFVYPKTKAAELAKISNEPVPTSTALTSDLTLPTAEREIARLGRAPILAEEPSGEEVAVAEAFPPAELPATGSTTPLIALIGMLSLAVGFGLRAYARSAS